MENLSYFEKLEVWKKACRLTVTLYELMREQHEFWIKDQMFRSALSIASNIAEGSERKSKVEFRRFIAIAKGSSAELRTQIYIATEIGMLAKDQAKQLVEELKTISKMLQSLYDSLKDDRKTVKL